MIKVELTKSRPPERKYRLHIDDKVFYQDTKSSNPRLGLDWSTPQSIHLHVGRLNIAEKIAKHTFNEIPKEIASIDLCLKTPSVSTAVF